ncbi:MAG: hypothetical protein ABL925_12910 [Methylococcales bacterium]
MRSNRQKTAVPKDGKVDAQQHSLQVNDLQDERYPGTFFRIPGVPTPGKTTWSATK